MSGRGLRRPGAASAVLAAIAGATLLFAAASATQAARPARAVPDQEPAVPAPSPSMRLMSQSQYLNTVANLFGEDVSANVKFAPVKRAEGLLAVGAATAVVTPGAFERLEAAARSVADQATDRKRREFLMPCRPASEKARDDACARLFLGKVGRLLYRRPLTERELELRVEAAGQAAEAGEGFYAGLSYSLSSLLASSNFLLIRETVEPDPAVPGARRLTGYSKAARLSLMLWDAAPDNELLLAAARGDLHDPNGLERQVERMIASPKLEQGVRAFFEDFLMLEAFDNLSKDPVIYPAFTTAVVKQAREQVLRTAVDHLVTRNGDYRDLFTSRRTMLSAGLAPIYRAPVDIGPNEWTSHEFAAGDPRGGLLTQVAFLSQYAHPGRSSPTRRGRGIREVLLCQQVPDPPPNVDFSIVEDPNAKFSTARERLAAHNADPTCAGCHKITDPIGLALENFDGAGQFRQTEKGAPIDASGVLDGVNYLDARGLGQALHDSQALRACVVNRFYAYSVGRSVTRKETPLLSYFQARLDRSGYRLPDLVRTIAYSKAFFAAGPQAPNQAIAMQR